MPGIVTVTEGGGEAKEALTTPDVAGFPDGSGMPGNGGREVVPGGDGAIGSQERQVNGQILGGLLPSAPEGSEKNVVAGSRLVAVEVGAEEGEGAEGSVEAVGDVQSA